MKIIKETQSEISIKMGGWLKVIFEILIVLAFFVFVFRPSILLFSNPVDSGSWVFLALIVFYLILSLANIVKNKIIYINLDKLSKRIFIIKKGIFNSEENALYFNEISNIFLEKLTFRNDRRLIIKRTNGQEIVIIIKKIPYNQALGVINKISSFSGIPVLNEQDTNSNLNPAQMVDLRKKGLMIFFLTLFILVVYLIVLLVK